VVQPVWVSSLQVSTRRERLRRPSLKGLHPGRGGWMLGMFHLVREQRHARGEEPDRLKDTRSVKQEPVRKTLEALAYGDALRGEGASGGPVGRAIGK
jgi:hypothetical protein